MRTTELASDNHMDYVSSTQSGMETAGYYPTSPRLTIEAAIPLKMPRKPRGFSRVFGAVMSVAAVMPFAAINFLPKFAEAQPQHAEQPEGALSLEHCDSFPANFGTPMEVDVDSYGELENFYTDYEAAKDFVADSRHITGAQVESSDVLCSFTHDDGTEVTVISPLATVHMWELDGIAPDAGATLVQDPAANQGYFELRPEADPSAL